MGGSGYQAITRQSRIAPVDDARIWEFERSLWVGNAELYEDAIDDECLMVVPAPPFVLTGRQAIEAVKQTPRWLEVEFSNNRVARPQEGLIVVAYDVHAFKEDREYNAHCTSTYRRLEHQEWRVIQHQQTLAQPTKSEVH